MSCREMSRTTKEPCGKPLPCADHSTTTNAPESAGGEAQLAPCPFCGGKATVELIKRGWRAYCDDFDTWCDMRPTTGPMVNKHEAVAAWNLRSTPAAPQPETEGMTEAERIEIANLTAEINLAIYNTIPNVTLAQVERVNVRAILTAAKGGRS